MNKISSIIDKCGPYLLGILIVSVPLFIIYDIGSSMVDGHREMIEREDDYRKKVCNELSISNVNEYNKCINPNYFNKFKIEYDVRNEKIKFQKFNNIVKELNQNKISIDKNSYELININNLKIFDLKDGDVGRRIKFLANVSLVKNEYPGRYKGQIEVTMRGEKKNKPDVEGYFVNRTLEAFFLPIVFRLMTKGDMEYFLYTISSKSPKDMVYATIIDTKNQYPDGVNLTVNITKILSIDNIDFGDVTFSEKSFRKSIEKKENSYN